MIFKKSKVLTDNIVDPITDESLRGHQANGKIKQIAETKTVSAIFVISLSGRIKHIVGLRGVQSVNSLNSEQFVHYGNISKRNFLILAQAEFPVHLLKQGE